MRILKYILLSVFLFTSGISFAQTYNNTGTANLQRAPTAKGYIYRNNMGALGNVNWYTAAQLDSLFGLLPPSGAALLKANNLSDVNNAATSLANINGVSLLGSYANPSWITSLAWGKITGTPTTLGGYGITDGITTTTFNTTTGTSTTALINLRELLSNKVTSLDSSLTHYPSTSAVKVGLSLTKSINTTVPGLRNITSPTQSLIYQTTGIVNDQWYYDPTDTTSPDNTGTVVVSTNGKRFKRVHTKILSITDFGCVGDGSDESSKIQTAINTAKYGTLLVPNGTFYCKNLSGVSNITIDGTGTLKLHSSAVINVSYIIRFFTDSNFVVKNITIDGNNSVLPGNDDNGYQVCNVGGNLLINPSFNGTFDNVKFYNVGGRALSISSSKNITVKNCTVNNVALGFITFSYVDDVKFTGSSFTNITPSEGISIWGGTDIHGKTLQTSNVLIQGNHFKNIRQSAAIILQYADKVVVNANTIDTCRLGIFGEDVVPVDTLGVSNATITANIMNQGYGTTSYGIVGQFSQTEIAANEIYDMQQAGISLGSAAYPVHNVSVHNNVIGNPKSFGIALKHVTTADVSHNQIYDDRTPVLLGEGIYIDSASTKINIAYNTMPQILGVNTDVYGSNTTITDNNGNVQINASATNTNIIQGKPFISNSSTSTIMNITGSGSPVGSLNAAIGSIYRRTNGSTGTTFYVNEIGGTGGWVPHTGTPSLQSVANVGSTTTTSLTANSFIKSGGTPSQFLKADGSIDASSYITSSSLPVGATSSALVGLTRVNGSATTFKRSDASDPLDQSIAPTMTGIWNFTNNIGINSAVPTNSLTFGAGNTGLAYYSTADQITNFQKVVQQYNVNAWQITASAGGTGVTPPIQITGGTRYFSLFPGSGTQTAGGSNHFFEFTWTTGGVADVSINPISTASAAVVVPTLSLLPTINQSASAGYHALYISPFEQAVGGGVKLLIDAGTNSAANGGGTHTSKFTVDHNGLIFGAGGASFSGQVNINNSAIALFGATPSTDPSIFMTNLGMKVGTSGNLTHNYTSYNNNNISTDNGTTAFTLNIPQNTSGTFALTSQLTSGTVTSITPGYGFTSSTPITTAGTLTIDTAKLTTRLNLTPLVAAYGDGRWAKLGSSNTFSGASNTFNSATVFGSGATFNSAITMNQQIVHNSGYQDIYYNSANTFNTVFGVNPLTANRTATLPDDDGTIALTKNINAFITGTPTIVAGAGAGTSPTVSVTTNGKQLQVTVTTGTLPTGTNATIATVTLASALSYTPYPVFSSANAATSLLNGASMVYMTSTGASNVTITAGTTALVAATSYVWNIAL